jgi:hypothetical protein
MILSKPSWEWEPQEEALPPLKKIEANDLILFKSYFY